MEVKINIKKNKIYSLINSKGLIGYFVNFENIIQTSFDDNLTHYYFNLKKKNKEKIYEFKKSNQQIESKKLKLDKGKGYQIIKKEDLMDVVDPLSATRDLLFSNNKTFKCNNKRKVYDGDDIYQIKLVPLKSNQRILKNLNQKYKIIKACKLEYLAIAGHKIKREKKLNSYFVNVYFSEQGKFAVPVYFESKSNLIDIKMYLSTDLTS